MEQIFLLRKQRELSLMTNSYKNKRVLIFGLGLNQGGLGSAKFFAKCKAEVRVTDLRNETTLEFSIKELKSYPDIKYTLGEHKKEDVTWADLIIKNAAIKPGNPFIDYAVKIGKQVKMDMDIFLEFIKPSQIIGVTGTKGKSTTTSLIYEILKNAGKKVILAGNIGVSVLDTISVVDLETLIVLEVSSFQLQTFNTYKVSPKWAVITNITPDHLNYHKDMEEYLEAKKVIGKYQTKSDYLFLRENDPVTTKPEFLKDLKGQIIYYSKDDLPKNYSPILKGEHNLENIAAALKVGEIFEIDQKRMLNIVSNFKGVPYRMEVIKNADGVKIINDTAATSPESATYAIQTYPGCILICGGMNKGMDYKEFAKIVNNKTKRVFLLEGDSTEEMKRLIKRDLIAGVYSDFEQLLKDVRIIAKKGDTILLSPAGTSFNLFQNEWDRGRKFNQAVEKVFR